MIPQTVTSDLPTSDSCAEYDVAETPNVTLQEAFFPTMRELARTYQAFETFDQSHIRQLGLTPSQFDVIATLGNTSGMTMNILAEKTLVTKGTLTGIVDRLEEKGLVRRSVPEGDRRCFTIILTEAGQQVFQETFPLHIAYLKQRFDRLTPEQLEGIRQSLELLRSIFLEFLTI